MAATGVDKPEFGKRRHPFAGRPTSLQHARNMVRTGANMVAATMRPRADNATSWPARLHSGLLALGLVPAFAGMTFVFASQVRRLLSCVAN
jgi:hypothetical protein